MKLLPLFLSFFFSAFSTNAQFYNFLHLPEDSSGEFLFHGDEFYFTYGETVAKIDITDPDMEISELFTSIDRPHGLTIHNNELFITENLDKRILKFDIEDPNPTLIEVVSEYQNPLRMIKKENTMFVNSVFPSRISKFDLNSPTPAIPIDLEFPSLVEVPNGMIIIGDEMFVALSHLNKIVKFNINDAIPNLTDVITTGLSFPHSFALLNDELFISNLESDKIVKFNINDPNPIVEDVFSVEKPLNILFKDQVLYVLLRDQNRIVRNIGPPLSISTDNSSNNIVLFPNPTVERFSLKNLSFPVNGEIFNSSGQMVKKFTATENSFIKISNLSKGNYFILIEKKKLLKFIKI